MQRRIRVFDSFDYALEGVSIRFSQTGFYKDHGYASADPATNQKAYGRLLQILVSDAERMDYFEGVPFLKVHEKITRTFDNNPFYFYRALNPVDNLKPTQEYLDYITSAYRRMDAVPQSLIEEMEATDVLTEFKMPDQTRNFIRDIENWPAFLHPLLIVYEGICQKIVEALWNRSATDWMIQKPQANSE